jgi:hypothetical protein
MKSANIHQQPRTQLIMPPSLPHSSPPLSNAPPSSHLTQTLLVLQHQLLITNELLLAAETPDHTANTHTATSTAAMRRKSSEFPRMALRFRAVRSRQRSDDSARIPGGDGVGWDILWLEKVSNGFFLA